MRKFVTLFFWLLTVVLTLLTFAGFLGRWHWFFDMTGLFRLQYTVLLLGLGGFGIFLLQPRYLALGVAPALLANLILVGPFFWPGNVSAAAAPDSTLQVLALNMFAHNDSPEAVVSYVAQSRADVVVLSEVRPDFWAAAAPQLTLTYPHVHAEPQRGHFGIVLLSRHPLEAAQTHRFGERGYPSIEATLQWQGQPVKVFGAHPHPPLGSWGTQLRNSELQDIQMYLQTRSEPLILLGDLNSAPWSAPLQNMQHALDLRHAALGLGLWPTWELAPWAAPLGLPYDHVLVSPEWGVLAYQVGPRVGSDHRPVLATLTLNARP